MTTLSHNICHELLMVGGRKSLDYVISASAQQGEVESGTRRKVRRLLSFQRYCHASRLLRGLVPHTPGSLHLLDDDYLGQAAVRRVNTLTVCISCESHICSENSFFSYSTCYQK